MTQSEAAGGRSAPLRGRHVLVTAGGELGERLVAGVQERGGTAVRSPLVRTERTTGAALGEAVARWNSGAYDWMVLTSAAGAAAVRAAGAVGAGAGPGERDGRRIAAVGPATAAAVAEAGLRIDLVPARDFSARGLAAALLGELRTHARVLLPVSELASDEVESALAAEGHRVERVTAYRTLPAPRNPWVERAVGAGAVDAILVSSGSAARELAARFAPLPEGTAVVAIGDPTAAALAAAGLTPAAIAVEHTAAGLLDALERMLDRPRPDSADLESAPADPDRDSAAPDPGTRITHPEGPHA